MDEVNLFLSWNGPIITELDKTAYRKNEQDYWLFFFTKK